MHGAEIAVLGAGATVPGPSAVFEKYTALAEAPRPPLRGDLSDAQAADGIARVLAWVEWARVAVGTDQGPEARLQIARVNAVISNVDPFNTRDPEHDVRHKLITRALDAASIYAQGWPGDPVELGTNDLLDYAQQVAPAPLGERLTPEAVRPIVADMQSDKQRKGVAALYKLLVGEQRTAEAKEIWDAYRKTRQRLEKRRGGEEK